MLKDNTSYIKLWTMYANLCQPNKIPKQITITKAIHNTENNR